MSSLRDTRVVSHIARSLSDQFTVRRANSINVTANLAKLTLDVEFRHHCPATGLFCGIMDPLWEVGLGFHVNYQTGEVVDLINGQGVIAYLNHAPLPENRLTFLHLDIDKFGPNLISIIEIGNERILYPALQLHGRTRLQALLGSAPADCPATQFGKARLRVEAK
ncbi:MAG: hypothetical protein AAGD22_16705 [Verrucomicrobiota bacterium]